MVTQQIDPVTGCYNPFLFNGEVHHGCMQIDAENFVCSLKPELTDDPNDIVYCAGAMVCRKSILSYMFNIYYCTFVNLRKSDRH